MIKKKKGSSYVVTPIILIISVLTLVYLTVLIINIIIPFIWYQKLNTVSLKYMFVVEKYGYLTDSEKNSFMEELKNEGFDTSKIKINATDSKKNYGEIVSLNVEYTLDIKIPKITNSGVTLEDNTQVLKINKNSFSKI